MYRNEFLPGAQQSFTDNDPINGNVTFTRALYTDYGFSMWNAAGYACHVDDQMIADQIATMNKRPGCSLRDDLSQQ